VLVTGAGGVIGASAAAEYARRLRFDNVSSTTELRQAGFADCLDTGDRFLELFDRLAAARVVPPLS
jgi:hypothetical protein